MKPSLRILVVEDHSLFAEALGGVVRGLATRVTVKEAGSAELGLAALEAGETFDLLLLDLGLPGLKGRAAFEALHARAGSTPIVIVSSVEISADSRELIRAGARGYVNKRASGAELLSVLRFVLDGGTHIPSALLHAAAPADEIVLTPRQREVLTLLAKGSSNREIAEALGISEATVRVHVSSIMRALDVENRTQAATTSYARRLVETD